jgi:hypothetical protein
MSEVLVAQPPLLLVIPRDEDLGTWLLLFGGRSDCGGRAEVGERSECG